MRWPWPAVLAWISGLIVSDVILRLGGPIGVARGLAIGLCVLVATRMNSRWRSGLVAAGLPALWLVREFAPSMSPAWWAVAAVLPLLVYPPKAWRDAPYFPTARGALDAVPAHLSLPPDARVLDAGCGLGRGLDALHRAWPQARVDGIEWSVPLWALAWLRCRWATVRRGDMWGHAWTDYDVVYVFQRPESMARVMEKAAREMRAGTWLLSLEFEAVGFAATAVATTPAGKPVWIYRNPGSRPGRR